MGSLAERVGIFSPMSWRAAKKMARLDDDALELARLLLEMTLVGRKAGLPIQWLVCQHCGAHSWVLPPHTAGQPCPLVKEHWDQVTSKMVTEQNQAILGGQLSQEMADFMKRHFTGETSDE